MTATPTPQSHAAAAPRALMEGSEALVRAAIAADCRFFAGYPMTPFTEVLEHFAALLPEVGGVCINAESEIEAVGMAWGAVAAGARAATGSTGQGLALMQESFSEATLAELPLVIFNMARSQGDYFQATRGGGHGDYRHIVLAPQDVREGIVLVQLAFHLADKWRNPVLLFGDYLLAHTQEAVSVERVEYPPLPPKDWAVDGTRSGTGSSRSVTSLGTMKIGQRHFGQEGKAQYIATKMPLMEREARAEVGFVDDAETVVVAFGSPAKFVKYAVQQLREEGLRVGFVRPITLWPFPADVVRDATQRARVVGSFEISSGQLVDDVRIAVAGAAPVEFIGGVSSDASGFGLGRLLDVDEVRERIRALHEGRPQPVVPGYDEFTYVPAPHQLEVTP
ncbi:MAG: 3-methyl-2-oxobutanoate dehydrogenase subunit VorB [Acidimicrobiia bacterium]